MKTNIVQKIESYILDYVVLLEPAYAFPIALWIIGTFCFEQFDAFPYLVITSPTKRSGKTRLSEMISFACSNPRNFAALTGPTIFRSIEQEKPTIVADEAEKLSSEAASTLRSVLNVGYRKGQTIPRTVGNGIRHYPTYCPKVFVLIGDVYDTLKDRSIIVTMRRAEPPKRFTFEAAQEAGAEIRLMCQNAARTHSGAIAEDFQAHHGLPFLMDRDEEIWTSLFVLCSIFAPERLRDLERIAVDMATEKTVEARRYYELEAQDRETEDEYARRLLTDLYSIFISDGVKSIPSTAAIEKLKALATSPWRKFKGVGLTPQDMGRLLSRFGVQNVLVQEGKGKNRIVRRGYKAEAVHAAFSRL